MDDLERTVRRLGVCCLLTMAALASGCISASRDDARIAYLEKALAADPRLYPVQAQLAEAWLDRARRTHDPADVREARAAVERSLDVQSNFAAFMAAAAIANFAHRFELALAWAQRAADAAPEQTAVVVERVEALVALGRSEEAGALVASVGGTTNDFNLLAARARWLVAEHRVDEAVATLSLAAAAARSSGRADLELWARVRAAGVLLDTGRADEARPHLVSAATLDPDDPMLRIHQAELLAAEGRPRDALAVYERLLRETSDPTIHAAAFGVARQAGEPDRARAHFEVARAGLERVIESGEVYTLGALARLLLEAGVELDTARDLAVRNLQHERDEQAVELLASIDAARARRVVEDAS